VLTRPLDYETQAHEHAITIRATDDHGGETVQSFTMQVADVTETAPLTLIGTRKKDVLVGDAMNDLVFGLGARDVLRGEGGNDKLYGGSGNDRLTGGAGQDVFVFNARIAKTNKLNKKKNLDKITDFKVPDDTIHLAKSVFKKLPKKGVLKKSAFYKGMAAHDSSDRIVYNKKKGALYYDKDGSGDAAAIQIAILSKNLKMTYKDFFVI
jgi:Ca2+-binding RTX toxin-like protein